MKEGEFIWADLSTYDLDKSIPFYEKNKPIFCLYHFLHSSLKSLVYQKLGFT